MFRDQSVLRRRQPSPAPLKQYCSMQEVRETDPGNAGCSTIERSAPSGGRTAAAELARNAQGAPGLTRCTELDAPGLDWGGPALTSMRSRRSDLPFAGDYGDLRRRMVFFFFFVYVFRAVICIGKESISLLLRT